MAQTYQLVLGSLPEKQWVAEAHSGDIDPGGSHMGSSFYHMDAGGRGSHCGFLPPTH